MPESTCLHIQDHESAPIRVVDLPWISVRIGRAAFCEVRLTADDLADEACRLYRRGRDWHLVPAGGKEKSKILLEGRPVDGSRPLPYDVPFRIGRFCLTLRQDRAVNPDWGMYPGTRPARPGWSTPAYDHAPADHRSQETRPDLVVEPQTVVEAPLKPQWRPHETTSRPVAGTERNPSASVKDRWETRWRVAGDEIKARARRSTSGGERPEHPFQAAFESVPLKEPQVPRTQPPERSHALAAARTFEAMPGAAMPEPFLYVEPAGRPEPPGPVSPPADEWINGAMPAEAFLEPVPDAGVADHRDLAASRDMPEIEPAALIADLDEASPPLDEESWYEIPAVAAPPDEITCVSFEELPDPPAVSSPYRPGRESPPSVANRHRPGTRRSRKQGENEREGVPRDRADRQAKRGGARRAEPDPAVEGVAWPSAKDILASHRPGARAQPARVPERKPTAAAGLTHPCEPAHWTVAAWIAGPPAATFIMVVGLLVGTLSWWWAGDAYVVSIMTGRLMSADGRAGRGALPDTVAPPEGTWARSTAQHLAHWAIFASRDGTGQPTSPREVAALLTRALQIAPLNPTARLAFAQLEPPEIGGPISQRGLGLSRDAVSLSWSARRVLAAGDKAGALKIFEKALTVASTIEAPRAAAPNFSDDPNVSRYLLPGEQRVQDVVREMISKNEWTFAEWSAVLPRNPASLLAAARVLRKQGSSDADRLLDLVLDEGSAAARPGTPNAMALAARAEACALKSRWRDSEEQYCLAIDMMVDDTIKRSWWFNLADVELQLEDDRQRQSALRAALADASDEISRRATDTQRTTGGRSLSRASGPKAN